MESGQLSPTEENGLVGRTAQYGLPTCPPLGFPIDRLDLGDPLSF